MIELKSVTIHKYKCIEKDNSFEVDGKVTVLVGMNESGKTSILEAIAKTNYFEADEKFKFNKTHDYPRKEKKEVDKAGSTPMAVTCHFYITDELMKLIEDDIGKGILTSREFSQSYDYKNSKSWTYLKANMAKFVADSTKKLGISSEALNAKLVKAKTTADIDKLISEYTDESKVEGITALKKYYENDKGEYPLDKYIVTKYLAPRLPKFLYYDEYYALPSRISIEKLQSKTLDENELKTAKALFELADIDIKELLNATDFEDFQAELEATEAIITEELFRFWSTNANLDIEFKIDKREANDSSGRRIVEHILDIRVKNKRSRVSLPLKNRSKGFNWFFSFLVWFKKIQEDENSNYILLLDEPGLNLHASAQADLLKFIESLSENYQIIYTTHSPFMVDPAHLERVRTVVEKTDGSAISDSIQEKDPNTLFPLQAALGYDLAQNLFISTNNLLVEGVSDLIYIEVISSILQRKGRVGLRDDITIVPVGGMDKVSTFVSLLRGNKLSIACLLDSSIETGDKAKLDHLVRDKIINKNKIKFYDYYIEGYSEADIEDLFAKEEYLQLFNAAFDEFVDICFDDLDKGTQRIILQINKILGKPRFNHYRPANAMALMGDNASFLSEETLARFEAMFKDLNSLFESK